jgi:hypothetical protein
MRAIGKILWDVGFRRPIGVEYKFDAWRLSFGPSIGVPGMLYVSITDPRGWEVTKWVETRREVFDLLEKRMVSYAKYNP